MHGTTNRSVAGAMYLRSSNDGAILVAGFGRDYLHETDLNWTFQNLQSSEDVYKHTDLVRHLPTIAMQLGVRDIYAPSPLAFNGQMISAAKLATRITFPDGLVVHRNSKQPADGCLLKPETAFAISAAGCAVLVGRRVDPHTKKVVRVGVAHMGLRSILNNASGNLLAALHCPPENAHFSIDFAIDPKVYTHPWDHPEYAKQNQHLCQRIADEFGTEALPGWQDGNGERAKGRIDPAVMAKLQLVALGVPEANVHVGPKIGDGSNFYTTRDLVEERRTCRNLLMVVWYG